MKFAGGCLASLHLWGQDFCPDGYWELPAAGGVGNACPLCWGLSWMIWAPDMIWDGPFERENLALCQPANQIDVSPYQCYFIPNYLYILTAWQAYYSLVIKHGNGQIMKNHHGYMIFPLNTSNLILGVSHCHDGNCVLLLGWPETWNHLPLYDIRGVQWCH